MSTLSNPFKSSVVLYENGGNIEWGEIEAPCPWDGKPIGENDT